MNFKTDLKQLGNFTITGQMKVSDPCYRPEVWCSGVLNTKPGVWEAAVMVLDNEDNLRVGADEWQSLLQSTPIALFLWRQA